MILEPKSKRVIRDIVSIGGITPGYEEVCQKMLQAGYEWMMTRETSFTTEDLREVMVQSVNNDCSGAQLDATLSHLMWIWNHTVDEWIAEATKRGQLLSLE